MTKPSPLIVSSKKRGQSLVEMGLTMMLVLWLLSGVVDFGIGFFSYVAIRDAAQEGALYGSINPTLTSDIVTRVQQSASTSPIDLAVTTVTVTTPTGTCPGNPITVTVVYNYQIAMPLTSIVTGNTIPIRTSATSPILKNPACH